MTQPPVARGSCYCGAVSVTVPSPLRRPGNCHCGECRRLSGAAFTTWITAPRDQVVVDKPEGLTVFNTSGQWRDAKKKTVVREPSKIVRVITPADAQANEKIEAIASAYKTQFRQDSVGVLMRPACVSF